MTCSHKRASIIGARLFSTPATPGDSHSESASSDIYRCIIDLFSRLVLRKVQLSIKLLLIKIDGSKAMEQTKCRQPPLTKTYDQHNQPMQHVNHESMRRMRRMRQKNIYKSREKSISRSSPGPINTPDSFIIVIASSQSSCSRINLLYHNPPQRKPFVLLGILCGKSLAP